MQDIQRRQKRRRRRYFEEKDNSSGGLRYEGDTDNKHWRYKRGTMEIGLSREDSSRPGAPVSSSTKCCASCRKTLGHGADTM